MFSRLFKRIPTPGGRKQKYSASPAAHACIRSFLKNFWTGMTKPGSASCVVGWALLCDNHWIITDEEILLLAAAPETGRILSEVADIFKQAGWNSEVHFSVMNPEQHPGAEPEWWIEVQWPVTPGKVPE